MVQWFFLIFSILFAEQASFFGYWFWYGPLTCFSWLSDFESFTYSGVLNENICECSKVRNRPVVYSRHEARASVYFGHISSFIYPTLQLRVCKIRFVSTGENHGKPFLVCKKMFQWQHTLYHMKKIMLLPTYFIWRLILYSIVWNVVYYIWATAWQNQQNDVRPVKTQISLGIRPGWSESSLSA